MKWGCGTLFWLQPLSGHRRPSPAAASPVSQRSCRYHCCLATCRFLLRSEPPAPWYLSSAQNRSVIPRPSRPLNSTSDESKSTCGLISVPPTTACTVRCSIVMCRALRSCVWPPDSSATRRMKVMPWSTGISFFFAVFLSTEAAAPANPTRMSDSPHPSPLSVNINRGGVANAWVSTATGSGTALLSQPNPLSSRSALWQRRSLIPHRLGRSLRYAVAQTYQPTATGEGGPWTQNAHARSVRQGACLCPRARCPVASHKG